MSVRLTHIGLPADMTSYRLKLLLQQARIALGLSSGALKYLEFAIDNCQPSDFQQGRICAIWHSPERIGTVFRLSKRQIGRIEAELVDASLIKRTYPERKSRSGDRVDGVIKRAAGINLGEYIDLYACGDPPDWQAVTRAAHDRAYELGVSSRLWRERCTQLGEARTALCLIVADRNSQRDGPYGRKNAAASFAGMARKEARQIAVLDGLVGKLTHALLRSGGNL